MPKRSKKKIVRIKPKNIALESLYTTPAFLPKVNRSGEEKTKYKRNKKVILEDE
jgi:hypothetical protein